MGLTAWGHAVLVALLCLGMLLVVPLGLGLVDGPWSPPRRSLWLLGAVPGAASLWLPRGWPAAVPAAAYLLITLWLLAGVPARLRPWRLPSARDLAVCTALAAPTVAASALVAERAGYRLFGFLCALLAWRRLTPQR